MTDENELHEGITSDVDLVVGAKTTRTYHFLYYVLWIIEILLGFRFILKMLAANPSNIFAEIIYGLTFLLMLPFQGIFPHKIASGGTVHMEFDPSILFAMVVYVVIIWGVTKFIVIKTSKSTKKKHDA